MPRPVPVAFPDPDDWWVHPTAADSGVDTPAERAPAWIFRRRKMERRAAKPDHLKSRNRPGNHAAPAHAPTGPAVAAVATDCG